MLKTNLEILEFIKNRLQIAKMYVEKDAAAYLQEDINNYYSISKNLSNYEKDYAVQLVLESLIKFIESDIK